MIDTNTALMMAFGVYLLLHGAVYLWYQSRKPRREDSLDRRDENTPSDTAPYPRRRRTASGIHRPEGRSRAVVLVAMILAACILAGVALWLVGGQLSGP